MMTSWFDGPSQLCWGVPGFTLAYGAAFAPNPKTGPPYFDFPFVEKNGQVERLDAVYARWDNGAGGWRA